jgi:acyl-CoA synthetase (AMP-forming)/AMP-acid ligase II
LIGDIERDIFGEAGVVMSAADIVRRRLADGNRVALVEGASGRRLSWHDVGAFISDWEDAGVGGSRVGLALQDPLSLAAAFLAALATGVTVAPVNPFATAAELEMQARALGLGALVTDSGIATVSGVEIRDGDLAVVRKGSAAGPPGGDAALVMSSSGTTGAPKVIPLTAAQLLGTATAVVDNLHLSPDDTGYSPLPLWHINGLVVGVLSAAVAGSRLVVDRRFSARSFWSVVEREAVTWLNLVPAIITVLASAGAATETGGGDGRGIAHPDGGAGRVRLARSASAPLAPAVRERFERRYGIPVVETYGMTEAASQITANPLGACRPGSVGRPAGLDLRVVDRGGHPLPAGEAGSVQIRGARVTSHYWEPGPQGGQRPATGPGGWLHTGDAGWLDDDGYLFLVGREDDVINRGGEKVQPREVEDVLLADARVMAAAVVGRPHPTVGEEPVAYVIAGPDAGDTATLVADLQTRAALALSRFKRPAEIIVAPTLPAGPTGKIRRAAVKSLAAATAEGRS